jgi:hypothetical protein
MSVLVDTSVWIDYLRSGNFSERLDYIIPESQHPGIKNYGRSEDAGHFLFAGTARSYRSSSRHSGTLVQEGAMPTNMAGIIAPD